MAFKLTPEAQARAAQCEQWHRTRAWEFGEMTDASLIATAEYCMRQAEPKHYAPGEPVYDATLWHIILPELMRRLKEKR